MLLRLGQTLPIALQIANGATAVFVRAFLYDATGTQLSGSPVSVPHRANGFYATNAVTMPNSSIVYVQYIVYTDASFATLLTTQARVLETYVLDTSIAAIRDDLERTGGKLDTRATQSSVNDIPTAPLLATDARLNNLDAAVSTRLATTNYIDPPTITGIVGEVERTGGMLSQRPTLAQIETSAVLANQTDIVLLAASLVGARTEFAEAISGLGVPLQAADYQAPNNDQIAEAVMNATVESGVTLRKSVALANAAMGGLTTGAGSGVEIFKSLDGAKSRIVSTVDGSGNRSSVVLDLD